MIPFSNLLQSTDLSGVDNRSASGHREDRGNVLCGFPIQQPVTLSKCPCLCWFDMIGNSAFWTGGKE